MTRFAVPKGAIYYASSKRRRVVPIDPPLRSQVQQVMDAVRSMLQSQQLPPPLTGPQAVQRCRGCSLRERCQPEAGQSALMQRARQALFDPDVEPGTPE
jgi:CRISPR-associated exonuclease Cas4